MAQSERIPIRKVAAQLGTSARTLRYYEEIGLLGNPQRGPGGVRWYTQSEVQRLQRILELRNSRGFTLDELKEFLAAEDGLDATRSSYHGQSDTGERLQALAKAEEHLQRELAVVEDKIKRLADLRQEIITRLERARSLRDALVEPTDHS